MYGKELQALKNSHNNLLQKDREIVRKFFHSQSQSDDKTFARQFRINSSHTKNYGATKISQLSSNEVSSITEAQRKSTPNLFSGKQLRGRGSDFAPSLASMEFNRTMSQIKNPMHLGNEEHNEQQHPIRTSSKYRRQMSYRPLERPQTSAHSTPPRLMLSGYKRIGFQTWQKSENSEPISALQQKQPQEAVLMNKKTSLRELSPVNQQKEASPLTRQSIDPSELRVDPEFITTYLMNRKRYSPEAKLSLRTSPKRQKYDDDVFVRKLTIQRIKDSFYLPRKTRSYFPEIHIDYKKLREIQRADAERLKEEQKHVLPPDQELKVSIWRKKIAITNLFRARKKNELTPDERKSFYKKLLAEYAPTQTNHPKEFAEEILLFLQQKKDVFVGAVSI